MMSNWWFPVLVAGLVLPLPAVAQTTAQAQVDTETQVSASVLQTQARAEMQARAEAQTRGQTQAQTQDQTQAPVQAQQGQAQAQAQAEAQAPQVRIDAALDAAARAAIPVSLLSSKVAEGEAKRVPRERIAAAVEARLSALVRAADTLRRAQVSAASAAELAVTADALSAGVSENAVIQLSRTGPAERRLVAVAVLADLVRLGQSHDPAFARVNAAVGAQSTLANLQAEVASSAALANLQAEVASQLQSQGLESTLDAAAGINLPSLPSGLPR